MLSSNAIASRIGPRPAVAANSAEAAPAASPARLPAARSRFIGAA